ncbi:MAG: RhuM family protein [Micropruina sp.]|uniref:RhuM family protein n=1 Tax=Micropruina sp. TaxID=2737536 RepID=UPI0039E63E03
MSEGEQSDERRALVRSSAAEYLTFVAATGDGGGAVELRYEDENIWLTQKLMAELYGVSVQMVSKHLQTLFESGELQPESVIKRYLITAADGKNYNTQHCSQFLNRLVSMYLDFAEFQAMRKVPMSIQDLAARLDGFLEFNGTEILVGPGRVSAEQAKLHAETEFERHRTVQDRLFSSDFDRFLEASDVSDKETAQ